MTIQELRDLVAAVQFRHGWALTATLTDMTPLGQPVRLRVAADVEDAYHEHALGRPPIRVASDLLLAVEEVEDMDEHEAIARIWDFILEVDEHEAREWFRVRGVRVLNPHEGTRER